MWGMKEKREKTMSLRKQARILGISHTYLSMLVNGKRKWPEELRRRYEELVTTFVTTNGGQSEIEEDRNLNFTHESGVSRLGFEPRTLGLKVRCSAKLSYRPTKVEGATCTGSSSMDHRNILEACAVPFMIPPPTRL